MWFWLEAGPEALSSFGSSYTLVVWLTFFYECVTKETWAVGFSITVAYPFRVSYTLSHRVYRWLIIICTAQVTVTRRWGYPMIASCTWRSEPSPLNNEQWSALTTELSHIFPHIQGVIFLLMFCLLQLQHSSRVLIYVAGGIDCEIVGLGKESRLLGERMKIVYDTPHPGNFLEPLC